MSKQLPWFRTYTRMVDDDKLKLLAFEDRWHFVALLCLKGEGLLDKGDAPSLLMRKAAVKLGLDVRTLEEVARRLAEVGLIDQATLQPVKWDGLQMRSDTDTTAADRKKRQREREKASKGAPSNGVTAGHAQDTDMSRVTGTNVTRTDTDTDTDKETEVDTPLTPLQAQGGAHQPAIELPEPHQLPSTNAGNSHPLAGAVCLVMKRLGVGLVNPGNAKLNALLNAGVGVGQFEDAAHKALAAGKSFSYALGIVEREEREARALGAQLQKPRMEAQPVNRQEALEARNRAVGDAWLQKMQMQTQGAGHAR